MRRAKEATKEAIRDFVPHTPTLVALLLALLLRLALLAPLPLSCTPRTLTCPTPPSPPPVLSLCPSIRYPRLFLGPLQRGAAKGVPRHTSREQRRERGSCGEDEVEVRSKRRGLS